MKNKIFVFSGEKKFKKFEFQTKKKAKEILKALRVKNTAIEIYLIGNSEMRQINKKFRNQNKPVNILSFAEPKKFPHPELKNSGRMNFLGEIYINIDQANEESGSNRFLGLNELLVHGLLHLMGYVHNRKSDRIKMEKKERLVLLRITTNLSANSTNKHQ